MENYSIVIFILAVMIALSAVADRIKIPSPILLITAGIAIGFIPSIPVVEINPEVIFLIFLPPLLYDAAFNISFEEFKTHRNTISALAISLVFITASGIAVVAYYLIPGMTWPLAFVLGSILSATDAVAAISITKGLGISRKTSTILEGESLVNDASALVAYRFAVAAVTGSAFVFWKASLDFIFLMLGGFLVGFVSGKILSFIIERVRENNTACISFMMLMPFVTYRFAEELNVSGVIAVVILGLQIARISNKVLPEHIKMQSRNIWEIIIFLLNGLIFIFIGLEFPYIARSFTMENILPYMLYALAITVAALILRFLRVYFQQLNLERAYKKGDGKVTVDALFDFRQSLVISWSGMRGIVSLAIAIGLPVRLQDGTPFPLRNTIIFISVLVVLFTLIGQGLTLPWLVRLMQKRKQD